MINGGTINGAAINAAGSSSLYVVPPNDPYYDNVSLLLEFDGTNNSVNFEDTSSRTKTVVTHGNSVITTGQGKTGGACGDFTDTEWTNFLDVEAIAGNTDFIFGTGDFTIEFWVKFAPNGVSTGCWDKNAVLVDFGYMASIVAPTILKTADNRIAFKVANNSTLRIQSNPVQVDQWYYIALSRVSGQTRLFINGTQEGVTYTDTNSYTLEAGTGTYVNRPRIGGSGNPFYGAWFYGYFDTLKITKGIGRYATDFYIDVGAGVSSDAVLSIDAVLAPASGTLRFTGPPTLSITATLPRLDAVIELYSALTLKAVLPGLAADILLEPAALVSIEATLPAFAAELMLEDQRFLRIDALLPELQVDLQFAPPTEIVIDTVLPELQVDLAMAPARSISIDATLPALSAEVYFHEPLKIDATLPALQAEVVFSNGIQIDATLPALQAELRFDSTLQIDAVLPALQGSLAFGSALVIDTVLPSLTADIRMEPGDSLRVNTVLPVLKSELAFYALPDLTLAATLPLFRSQLRFTPMATYLAIDAELPGIVAELEQFDLTIDAELPGFIGQLKLAPATTCPRFI